MQVSHPVYDVVVVGGGINGVGVAVDAVGRGLSVFLCEKDDLASHTSSASSKLIHGGLRYLEHKEFRLVREALAEREILLAKAPHIIRPLRFIMPHQPHLRPAWLIRTGLFFYDHLGKREKLAGSKHITFDAATSPLKAEITQGFEYSDCAVDDARLVVLNAIQAREQGAHIATQTRCTSAYRENGLWVIDLENTQGRYTVQAKALVNAAGPWVAQFIQQNLKQKSPYGLRLIQGSHIVVPKIYAGDKAFILQNDDHRIVFAIPYLDQYTLIGTTDHEYQGDLNKVTITQPEMDYLLDVYNDHFKHQLGPQDILYTYSGVRSLCDDESDNPSAITRDYTLALSQEQDAPLLSVFGGKLTTYRKLAESALTHLQPFFPTMKKPWTEKALLPGAENLVSVELLIQQLIQAVQDVSVQLASRWAHAYGSRVWIFLNNISMLHELGQDFRHGLYAQEVDYLVNQEWAITSSDILWRRSKLGLEFTETEIQALDEYLLELHKRRAMSAVA
ncbi:glycerol-3-phosphate dehydrogenase [Acinetobacter bohemicus]|uniref:Glycerol-3-phosphate dehydrogenase n=2 Tax=Pseudomonadota TaxID=1224 RepID=A0A1I6P1F3_9GAMM|nr:glycerol-3-phosphate dehydrogenase [Acinetobacter bohemicus]KAB0655177.1 glycerol-3-phosphate dehydrogenase [Acinetobacter bohemicus]SFS34017.1 glycerol-3-phosphate dehydrogenase [Acinetobacter bohemicus]